MKEYSSFSQLQNWSLTIKYSLISYSHLKGRLIHEIDLYTSIYGNNYLNYWSILVWKNFFLSYYFYTAFIFISQVATNDYYGHLYQRNIYNLFFFFVYQNFFHRKRIEKLISRISSFFRLTTLIDVLHH